MYTQIDPTSAPAISVAELAGQSFLQPPVAGRFYSLIHSYQKEIRSREIAEIDAHITHQNRKGKKMRSYEMGSFARGISQQFSSFHNIDGPNLCLPTQFFCVKSKVRPVEHSQTKLPRVLRQIPFLHKPGNWVHSSMSENHKYKDIYHHWRAHIFHKT